MSQNQSIQDGGSVIGYRPTLEYKKERNSTEQQAIKSAEEYETQQSKIEYSNTLQSFIESCPSETLKNLQASSEYLQNLIDKLSKAFPGDTYSEYGSIAAFLNSLYIGNDEFAMEFLNWHKHDIQGSQIPELIHCIYCSKTRLDRISDTVKQLYYGNSNITVVGAEEIDDACITQLRVFENSNFPEKANYYALAMDSELNRIIITHTYGVNKMSARVARIPDSKDDSTTSSANIDLVKNLFTEVNDELDNRLHTYNTQQSVDIIEKALYNYYQKRKSVLDVYSLLENAQTSIWFNQRLQERQNDVYKALGNVSRSFRATELYTDEFTRLEQEKHFLKDIYGSFNYTSDE